MKVGPFALLPGQLAVVEPADIEEWEPAASKIFAMQKYVPWWIGDMVVFGESQFGDDFWQVPPEDSSEAMIRRYMGVARKIPPEDRCLALSWSHHVSALRIANRTVRQAALRRGESERMSSADFGRFVSSLTE